MTHSATAAAWMETRIAELEEVLAEYVLRYGLTDRARVLFREPSASRSKEAGIVEDVSSGRRS